ncbi:hypothetical protein DPMN_098149 [Dreissena polymorpha]|uniref:Uncharacterized protein n=1 Tax=Dreissena polymorpha TaxID=45954 RepID=A0A9D4LEM2_DREPO|nr:hypothetical protein DPMN_098149 [Dreissena polymorpha]
MANALLDKENSPFHEFSMKDDSAEVESVRSHRSHSTKPKSSRTPRASKKKNWMNSEKMCKIVFECIDSKLDNIFNVLNKSDTAGSARQRPTDNGTSRVSETVTHGADTVVRKPLVTLPEQYHQSEDDIVSLMPGHRERTDLLGDDVSESESLSDGEDDRFFKYGVKTCNLLQDMFGFDATTKADSSIVGISLDNSQISVLRETWRTDKPAKLSAYKDYYRLFFSCIRGS